MLDGTNGQRPKEEEEEEEEYTAPATALPPTHHHVLRYLVLSNPPGSAPTDANQSSAKSNRSLLALHLEVADLPVKGFDHVVSLVDGGTEPAAVSLPADDLILFGRSSA